MALVILLPALSTARSSPFSVKKRHFKRQIKTIAVAPIDITSEFDIPEEILLLIEEEIAKGIRGEGYDVIPASEYRAIRMDMAEQVGGIMNSRGQIDLARNEAVMEHSYREMVYRHRMDATAIIRIEEVSAFYKNDMADWDGVRQKVKWRGHGNYEGRIPATSIRVTIFDLNNRALYSKRGGLEIMMRRVNTSFLPLSTERFFKDKERIRQAADVAVRSL
jgi:hypothetical protein